MNYDPNEEGITHINIYSKAQSPLGRILSNFDRRSLQTSIGYFQSVEGLIFYLGSFDDRLRTVAGYTAKTLGEQLDRGIRLPDDVFKRLVVEAMECKANKKEVVHLLRNSTLPFTHYYHYGTKIIQLPKWAWQVEEWEKIRTRIKNGGL